ncbi:MAG: hypothetical protein ACYTGL_19630 [Planctomycetota bacterium]|jgi:hypothetical protein
MTLNPRSIAILILLTSGLTGCSTVELADRPPRTHQSATASKCLCLWQQTEAQRSDGQAVRGFGGQVYFFPAEGEKPVSVDGTVHVFLFDDVGSSDEQARPIYETTFSSVEWNSMLSESQFGPVYSLFVPYPRGGKYEANCTVRVGLTGNDGSRVFSDMTPVRLAGLPRHKEQPVDRTVDPRREQQWVSDQQVVSSERTARSETIGVRRGDRFITMAGHSSTSDGVVHDLNEPAPSSSDKDRNSRVQFYEQKLESLLRQRRVNQAEQRRDSARQIEQMSYEQPSSHRDSGNPFLDFAE